MKMSEEWTTHIGRINAPENVNKAAMHSVTGNKIDVQKNRISGSAVV